MIKTIRIILYSTQNKIRLESVLNLIKRPDTSYNYYNNNHLFYITIEYDETDIFPFESLGEFIKLLKYKKGDSIIILNNLEHIIKDI